MWKVSINSKHWCEFGCIIWPVLAIFSYIKTENLTKNTWQVKPVHWHPPSTVWVFSWLWGSCFSWCFEVWLTQHFPSSWGSECACNHMSKPTKHKHSNVYGIYFSLLSSPQTVTDCWTNLTEIQWHQCCNVIVVKAHVIQIHCYRFTKSI